MISSLGSTLTKLQPYLKLRSTLVANMTRQSHLQLFGRENLEKRAYLKKLQNVDCKNYTIK